MTRKSLKVESNARAEMRGRPSAKASRKSATRQAILSAAAELFRRDGYHATGVDAVMAAAGLTAGGFYAHFRSKADLLANVLASAKDVPMWATLEASGLAGADWLRAMLDGYLGPAHRDRPAEGCMLAALGPEVARGDPAARAAFEAAVVGMSRAVDRALATAGGAPVPSETALAWVALAVGAQVLARGVADRALSDRILEAARTHLESSVVTPAASRATSASARTRPPRKSKRPSRPLP